MLKVLKMKKVMKMTTTSMMTVMMPSIKMMKKLGDEVEKRVVDDGEMSFYGKMGAPVVV